MAAILAVLVLAGGILFLLSRDGTEEYVRSEAVIEQSARAIQNTLPSVNNTATSTEETEIIGENSEETDGGATSTESAPPNEQGDTVIVAYTDAGFSPKTLTIAEGDTVTFMNESGRNMWVASAIHPTHNEYPIDSDTDCLGSSFDSCTGIPKGGSWSFVFEIAGEWEYHDHLRASRTGTIIVE